MAIGLYVHIPFCSAICGYCNFNRGLFESGLKDRYLSALEQEIRASAHSGEAADTIFFGGGTPSLLEPAEIAGLIRACRDTFDLATTSRST
jgi:oxygen-independent coproporphyrinogen-3 oxidase